MNTYKICFRGEIRKKNTELDTSLCRVIYQMGHIKRKKRLNMCKMHRFRSSCTCNDSVIGQ